MGVRETLKAIALKLPHVEQGIACKGTALESITFNVRKKAFLFVGASHARFKLRDAIAEATKLAVKKEPMGVTVGSLGWVKVSLAGAVPPRDVLEHWVAESYRIALGVPKTPAKKASEAKPR
jgi:hypothetical protein